MRVLSLSADPREFAVTWETDRARVDDWVGAGVEARRQLSVEDLLATWADSSDRLYAMMRGAQPLPEGVSHEFLAWAAVGDIATHYQDLRGALEIGSDRDKQVMKLAYATYRSMLIHRAAATAGIPALRVTTQRGETTLGEGAARTVEIDWFEFLRAITGRRNVDQIRALFNGIDADPYLPVISAYPLPVDPLEV